MPVWRKTIYLGDVFHNDAMSFPDKRTAIVAKIRKSGWPDQNPSVADLVASLSRARTVARFDQLWARIYDQADIDRVWIDTVSHR